jgi:predicted nucleotidyltransferase component of viral defense system
VRQRLLNLAKERGEEFNVVLARYANERLLYRLSVSKYRSRFVLKGATLIQAWGVGRHRATRDLDLLGHGESDPAAVAAVVREICGTKVEDDGLVFAADSIQAARIREDQVYEGVRVRLTALLAGAAIPVQVDVGFGDAVTPQPRVLIVPTLLDHPAPKLAAYPRESVVAEKLEAMVVLGIGNSRMKDFFDVAYLAQHFAFDGARLVRSIRTTFLRRGTAIPDAPPIAFTRAFAEDPSKAAQWKAFTARDRLAAADTGLDQVVAQVAAFLSAPLVAALRGDVMKSQAWAPGGPWRRVPPGRASAPRRPRRGAAGDGR